MDGRLGIREDIFHLSIEEIQTALECPHYLLSRETVEARKRLFEKEQETTPPYLWKDSEEVTVQKGEGYASYKGTGISLGCARGPARRLQSIRDIDDVRQGDICVVDTFHPSWTPALKMAAGLIMSYGNMLSHGAVVAREYGIPVVVSTGTRCACSGMAIGWISGGIRDVSVSYSAPVPQKARRKEWRSYDKNSADRTQRL